MKRILLFFLACLMLFCSGCEEKEEKKEKKSISTKIEENVADKTAKYEQLLTAEKWIDTGFKISDTLEYTFLKGGTYEWRTLSGETPQTGVYEIKGDTIIVDGGKLKFEYIESDGVFRNVYGERLLWQDESYNGEYCEAIRGTRYLMPKSLYYSETIYGGLPLSEAGIDEAYEILDCYHGLYISDCLCADHDYNNRLPNSFNGWSDLYPVKNFNSIKEIREHYLKYVTKEYLDNSNFALWCDEYFEEYGNKLYMRFPSFGFDTFNTDLAEITKMDEDKYLISQPYFVCDNFCCTVLIIIEKIDGSYKMTFSRESQMNYNLGY